MEGTSLIDNNQMPPQFNNQMPPQFNNQMPPQFNNQMPPQINQNPPLTTDNFSSKIINNDEQIKKISKDILNGLKENDISLHDSEEDLLDDDKPKKLNKKERDNLKDTIDYVIDGKPQKHFINYVYDTFYIKEFVLIFAIYLFLSQDMIKDFFSEYFTSLNPGEDGKVGVKGIVIYGLILSSLFILIKKLFPFFNN